MVWWGLVGDFNILVFVIQFTHKMAATYSSRHNSYDAMTLTLFRIVLSLFDLTYSTPVPVLPT